MKKIAVVVNLIILFSFTCIAQNRISKNEFELLIDYANCKYLMAFIEQYDAQKPYIKDTYEKSIKPILRNASLDYLNNVPSFNKIKELFPNNSNNAALQLAEQINIKKSVYNNKLENDALIKTLYVERWENVDLSIMATEVQMSVRKKYNLASYSQQNIENDKKTVDATENAKELQEKNQTLLQRVEALEQKNRKIENENKELDSPNRRIWIALFFTWIILIVLLLISRKKVQSTEMNRDKIIKTVLGSQRIESEFSSKYFHLSQHIEFLKHDLTQLTAVVKELQNRVTNNIENDIKDVSVNNTHFISNNTKYFKSTNVKVLTEELQSSTDAYFMIYDIGENEAKFAYCGAVVNQDFLTDVCSFVNNPSDVPNKTRIITTIPGTVKHNSDNNWEVVEKAKIRFE